ncbi:MAG: hypothetical protein SGPRY_010371, partial [Prymnesium sp.]
VEEESGTFCFVEGGRGESEQLLIFGHDKYDRDVAERLINDLINEKLRDGDRGRDGYDRYDDYDRRDRDRYDDRYDDYVRALTYTTTAIATATATVVAVKMMTMIAATREEGEGEASKGRARTGQERSFQRSLMRPGGGFSPSWKALCVP